VSISPVAGFERNSTGKGVQMGGYPREFAMRKRLYGMWDVGCAMRDAGLFSMFSMFSMFIFAINLEVPK
jgi:hypothetical protein